MSSLLDNVGEGYMYLCFPVVPFIRSHIVTTIFHEPFEQF